ncbi:MAG: hypothetical protein H7249_09430 [Chitinophagaceae bacterium]|nr:hypothetical protein [Oligoflexus sp.]
MRLTNTAFGLLLIVCGGCRHTADSSQTKSLRDISDRPLIERTLLDVSTGEPIDLVVDSTREKPAEDARLFISSLLITLEQPDSEDVCAHALKSVNAKTSKGLIPLIQIDHGEGESTFIFGNRLNLVPLAITELLFTFDKAGEGSSQCRLTVAGDGHWESGGDIGYTYVSDNPARDKAIKEYGSAYEHRLHHYLWHTTRGLWNGLVTEIATIKAANATAKPDDPSIETSKERLATLEQSVKEFQDAGWAPPRYFHKDEKETTLSGAGEDFLFMHNRMLQELGNHLKSKGLPMVPAWDTLPTPDDNTFPLAPAGFPKADLSEFKTDAYFYEKQTIWESAYKTAVVDQDALAANLFATKSAHTVKEPAVAAYTMEDAHKEIALLMEPRPGIKYTGVKGITLSEYGHLIEMTIHNNLHTRYAVEGSSRPANTDPLDRGSWMADWAPVYDTPSYDWLGDTYSSHVNPWFYRIHGWIDARIRTWLEINDYKSIGTREECKSAAQPCYVWLSDKRYQNTGTVEPWEGPILAAEATGGVQSLHAHKAPLFSTKVIKATRGLRAQHASMNRILLNPGLIPAR